jgi:hypothetical protein
VLKLLGIPTTTMYYDMVIARRVCLFALSPR